MSDNLESPVEAVVETPISVEQPTTIIEQPVGIAETLNGLPVSDDLSVIYSLKNTKDVKKGYSKISKSLADELVKKYSFVRFASKEEISKYL